MRVNVEVDAVAQMRDGTTLKADVYRPDGDGPWPTLLHRTPYSKGVLAHKYWAGVDPVEVAKRGFMVVVQDTRGRFASGGDWSPFRYEREDGFDSVQWAAGLPGSSGRVGMYGSSYCGNTQWTAALDGPPALAAISPMMTWSDPGDGLFSRGGALELGLLLSWSLLTGMNAVARRPLPEEEIWSRIWAIADDWDRLAGDGYWRLPVADLTTLAGHEIPNLGSVAAISDPEVAGWTSVAGNHELIDVPSLNSGGWYDVFLQGTIDNYTAMASRGVASRLLIGPWTHQIYRDPIGESVFGIRAARDGVPVHDQGDWNDLQLAWLRGKIEPEAEAELPAESARIFVMGRNEWRNETSWPPVRARPERWFAHADGSLAPQPPNGGTSGYTYDPDRPVPTRGGQTLLVPGFPAGAYDQREIEARDDVLVFTSAPLDGELEVAGRIRVILAAESSAPSTDWVARLCDVHPDGRSLNLCDGILRAGPGAGDGSFEVDLWSTCNVFLPGHRLRLQITSSSFPRWDRNLNTGDPGGTRSQPARQTLHHDAARACFIELPVIRPG